MKARSIDEFYRFRWLAWMRASAFALREFGLVYDDVLLMSVIAEIGRRSIYPNQEKLARDLCMDASAVARRLARLQKRGLLVRRSASTDERMLRVSLTRAGRESLAVCEMRLVALRRQVFLGDHSLVSGKGVDRTKTRVPKVIEVKASFDFFRGVWLPRK